MPVFKSCSVSNCLKPAVVRGLCDTHRKRVERHGSIEDTRPADWGSRNSHPMYKTWHWLTRRYSVHKDKIVQEWLDDFWKFVDDVGDRPSVKHSLHPVDGAKPLGPNNWFWREPKVSTAATEEGKKSRREYQKNWRKANQHIPRNAEFKRHYGITLQDYDVLLIKQAGVCKICGKEEVQICNYNGVPRRLAVDHCHTTGRVRGLLCATCNQILGLAKDDTTILQSAISYLTTT